LITPPLPVPPIVTSAFDVRGLGSFLASQKQQDDLLFSDSVVDPVPRAEIDPDFPHSITAKFVIAQVAGFDPIDPPVNRNSGFQIANAITPFHERVFLLMGKVMANFVHYQSIVYKRNNYKRRLLSNVAFWQKPLEVQSS
jgi:hypothetical protein